MNTLNGNAPETGTESTYLNELRQDFYDAYRKLGRDSEDELERIIQQFEQATTEDLVDYYHELNERIRHDMESLSGDLRGPAMRNINKGISERAFKLKAVGTALKDLIEGIDPTIDLDKKDTTDTEAA